MIWLCNHLGVCIAGGCSVFHACNTVRGINKHPETNEGRHASPQTAEETPEGAGCEVSLLVVTLHACTSNKRET